MQKGDVPEKDLAEPQVKPFATAPTRHDAVAQAMRLHASGTVRRIYASGYGAKSKQVRAAALFLAHKHLHEHRPDLVARGLPPPLQLGDYGVAVGMPAKSAADSVRKCVKNAFEKGVRDGAVEGSF